MNDNVRRVEVNLSDDVMIWYKKHDGHGAICME